MTTEDDNRASDPKLDIDADAGPDTDTETDPGSAPGATGGADRIAALEAETAQLKDQLLRTLAEAENARRRAERERQDVQKYAVAGFARDMVAVADNLRRALDSVPTEALTGNPALQALAEGVDLTEREALAAFERHGLKRIEPTVGDKFDPNWHQAMFEVEDAERPTGTIVQVLQTGYQIHDRLLRAAMVGVARFTGEAPPAKAVDTTA